MPNTDDVIIQGSERDREYQQGISDDNDRIALMAAILLAGRERYQNSPFPDALKKEVEDAVITAEKIFATVWIRNSSSQVSEAVVDAAEEAHFNQ